MLVAVGVIGIAIAQSLVIAIAQSPPSIGSHYRTEIVMSGDGSVQSGTLYASGDFTLFEQVSPATPYPNELNLCNHGVS